jgi:glyoxylase-like metal-dependent hydrolase (beta-lactamase superfamily II)
MWTVNPIRLGELEVDQSNLTALRGAGAKVWIPCTAWVVSNGNGDNIVVDVGPPDPAVVLQRKGRFLRRDAGEDPAEAFRAVGLEPEAVRDVVITHLHWDHVGNLGLFPNARLLVQRAELSYAIAPFPLHVPAYEVLDGCLIPLWVEHLPRVVVLDGEVRIREGVSLHPLPGHTPGFQAVRVATEGGAYLIASDAIPTFENWDLRIPSATYVDLAAYEASFAAVERLADHVLPGHDQRVFEHRQYPPMRIEVPRTSS